VLDASPVSASRKPSVAGLRRHCNHFRTHLDAPAGANRAFGQVYYCGRSELATGTKRLNASGSEMDNPLTHNSISDQQEPVGWVFPTGMAVHPHP